MEPEYRRTRVRFDDLEYEEFPDGRCQIRVHLEWEGRKLMGEARGTITREGKLRTGAQAALSAVEKASDGRLSLSLLGVKAMRVFDAWVIIASLEGRSAERSYRLLGAQTCAEGGTVRAAALTILDATNRVFEKYTDGG